MRSSPLVSLILLAASIPQPSQAQSRTLHWSRMEASFLGAFELTDIPAAVPLPGGGIIVTQTADPRLLVAVKPGLPSLRFGRDGEGPGEYRNLRRIGLSGTGFWISDQTLGRVTFLDSAGRVREIVPHPSAIQGPDGRSTPASVSPIAFGVNGGSIVEARVTGASSGRSGWAASISHEEMVLLALSPDGKVRRELERLLSAQATCTEPRNIDGLAVMLPRPLCVPPLVLTGPDGSIAVVRVAGDQIGIAAYSAEGALHHRSTLRWDAPMVTAQIRDSVRRVMRQRFRIPAIADAFDAQPMPATFPVVTRAVAGEAGTVWLKVTSVTHGNLWRVVAANGRVTGEVSLDKEMHLLAARGEFLWVQEDTPDGEPRLVRLRVRK